MKRALLGVVIAAVAAAPAASAAPAITKKQAIAIVRGILNKRAAGCQITSIISITATSAGLDRWHVTATIRDHGYRDKVRWTIVNRKAVPNDQLAAEIAAGCP